MRSTSFQAAGSKVVRAFIDGCPTVYLPLRFRSFDIYKGGIGTPSRFVILLIPLII
jgi:hypothetical protein